jgi:excisionase family DNA binding protein
MMLTNRVAATNGEDGGSALLSAPQVAELFDVPESWVTEQARHGTLPSIRLGHYVRFKAEEIQRFVAEHAKQAALTTLRRLSAQTSADSFRIPPLDLNAKLFD